MAKASSLIIIDEKTFRGVLAPSRLLPKKMLENLVDFIELSTPESIKEDERLIREANRDNSWVPLEKVIKSARRAK